MARHLVATGRLIDEDPELALSHALAARRLAARIAVVREAVGLAAYRAGEWQTAIAELRTYHRMTGRQTHLAVLADCERALGRPERAIDIYRGADRAALDQAGAIELLIVAAGARSDLGQGDAALAMLQVRELNAPATEPWAARLRYAYADALLAAGRREEAREWFVRAADADEDAETDAAERILELDGVVLEEDSDDEDEADSEGEDTVGAGKAEDSAGAGEDGANAGDRAAGDSRDGDFAGSGVAEQAAAAERADEAGAGAADATGSAGHDAAGGAATGDGAIGDGATGAGDTGGGTVIEVPAAEPATTDPTPAATGTTGASQPDLS